MAEVQITYNYIVNLVKQFCKNHISNYTSINNVPAACRNGYSINQDQAFGSYVTLRLTRTVANSIAAVTDATIESDMSSFLTNTLSMNATRLAKVVNNNNYLNFLIDLAIFATTKMCITTYNDYYLDSNHKTNPTTSNVPASVIIYVSSNNTYANIRPMDLTSIDNNENELILTASEVQNQIQTIISTVSRSSIRTLGNKVTFGITLL